MRHDTLATFSTLETDFGGVRGEAHQRLVQHVRGDVAGLQAKPFQRSVALLSGYLPVWFQQPVPGELAHHPLDAPKRGCPAPQPLRGRWLEQVEGTPRLGDLLGPGDRVRTGGPQRRTTLFQVVMQVRDGEVAGGTEVLQRLVGWIQVGDKSHRDQVDAQALLDVHPFVQVVDTERERGLGGDLQHDPVRPGRGHQQVERGGDLVDQPAEAGIVVIAVQQVGVLPLLGWPGGGHADGIGDQPRRLIHLPTLRRHHPAPALRWAPGRAPAAPPAAR